MKLHWEKFEIKDGEGFKINAMETGAGQKKPDHGELKKMLQEDIEAIGELQYKLYAENRQSLLIVLQGLDSAGKDSTIRHLMSGLNPQGLLVHSFKHPSLAEMEHDYLWRYILQLPEKGEMVIFNRSHYENVLISKVHPEIVLSERIPGVVHVKDVNKEFWETRYRQINSFEKTRIHSGTRILKFFLHLSKDEQRIRFLERIEQQQKHWKFSSNDIIERDYWDDYQQAYEDAIRHTSAPEAPWYVIPADNKWYTHLLIGKIILEQMKKMDPAFPEISSEEKAFMNKAKARLLKEMSKEQKK